MSCEKGGGRKIIHNLSAPPPCTTCRPRFRAPVTSAGDCLEVVYFLLPSFIRLDVISDRHAATGWIVQSSDEWTRSLGRQLLLYIRMGLHVSQLELYVDV
jgi:hypothetical protein